VDELAAQTTELAGHLNAGDYRWLALIAEFDRLQGWSDGSTSSCAHWHGNAASTSVPRVPGSHGGA
jgi:hypothetical protein